MKTTLDPLSRFSIGSLACILLSTLAVQAADFSPYSHYIDVVIQHQHVYSDETALPVVLDLAQLPSGHALWSTAQADGEDLRAGNADGSVEYDIEVVGFDPVAENAWVWINPNWDQDADVTVRIYYGNATTSAYPTPEDVWADFAWVYHLEESSGNLLDSGPNGWDLTAMGNLPDDQTGKVGQAQDFDGSGDYGQNTLATHDLTDCTLLAWVYRSSTAGGYDTVVSGDNSWVFWQESGKGKCAMGHRQDGQNNKWVQSNTQWSTNTWQHWSWTRSGNSCEWFLDGVSDKTDTLANNQPYTRIQVGRNDAYGGSDEFKGRLDEIMMYNGVLSAGAIRTIHTSMTESGFAT